MTYANTHIHTHKTIILNINFRVLFCFCYLYSQRYGRSLFFRFINFFTVFMPINFYNKKSANLKNISLLLMAKKFISFFFVLWLQTFCFASFDVFCSWTTTFKVQKVWNLSRKILHAWVTARFKMTSEEIKINNNNNQASAANNPYPLLEICMCVCVNCVGSAYLLQWNGFEIESKTKTPKKEKK